MWICPKCGREFKRTNQGHYCGKAPETVEEYIAQQTPEAQAHVTALREIFLRCVPDITEKIAWSMPTYKKDGRSVCFAACQKHVSLYIEDSVLECFRPQLGEFKIQKKAIYLPYDKELPLDTLESMVKQSFL